ncbi:hypothetical protein EVAR_14594_1 [Eumeta japonica]|uniref:Uncharacterized protein n=1 Tax=Eumeta variegata TaxID=151549 RepID=A0A4C1UVP8_EUMVA|nr:hypothetical protein EVAR_14594_1 [Eumeta japonica]
MELDEKIRLRRIRSERTDSRVSGRSRAACGLTVLEWKGRVPFTFYVCLSLLGGLTMPEWKGRVPLTRSHCERITIRPPSLAQIGIVGDVGIKNGTWEQNGDSVPGSETNTESGLE